MTQITFKDRKSPGNFIYDVPDHFGKIVEEIVIKYRTLQLENERIKKIRRK